MISLSEYRLKKYGNRFPFAANTKTFLFAIDDNFKLAAYSENARSFLYLD